MLKTERQKQIIIMLNEKEIMSVSELSEKLQTSMMTIRRDLEALEEKNLIKKVYGGAMLFKRESIQPSFVDRLNEHNDAKNCIAREAARHIVRGSIVFFDASTTTLALAQHIPMDLPFTVITNALMTAITLSNYPQVEIIHIGGTMHHSSLSSIGHIAVEAISKFNVDAMFFSTKAFSLPLGAFESELSLIEIKKAMMKVSKKLILLADHTKFENRSLSLSVPVDNIDIIITDKLAPSATVNALMKMGKEVILTS